MNAFTCKLSSKVAKTKSAVRHKYLKLQTGHVQQFPTRGKTVKIYSSTYKEKSVNRRASNSGVGFNNSNLFKLARTRIAPRQTLFTVRKLEYSTGGGGVLKVPNMGDSISEGTIKAWHKKPGDLVKQDELLAEIETDKITVEIRAPYPGTLGQILAKPGDVVAVGQDLYSLSGSGAAAASTSSAPSQQQPSAAPKPQAASTPAAPQQQAAPVPSGGAPKLIKVPNMGDSISSGVIQDWRKKKGDSVQRDDLIALIETDKVTVEVRAPEPGIITATLANTGDTVAVGQDLFALQVGSGGGAATPSAAPAAKPAQQTAAPTPTPQQATPATKPAAATATSAPSQPTGAREEHRVKMTQMRKRIANRLKDSQNTAAMLTTFNEIDMHNLMQMRNQFKDVFAEKHGAKLGFMSAFCRAAAIALKEYPLINAVIDGNDIVYRDYVDLSVAVSVPTGLVVPVLRNVEKMSFADIEKTLSDLGKKAKDNKLTLEDMTGGTFTISNGGVYGSLMGTPIINPPQSAILGMHAINSRAHVVNDKIEIRPIMFVALTYDHRLIDGRDAVLFLKKIKTLIEEPYTMLLDL